MMTMEEFRAMDSLDAYSDYDSVEYLKLVGVIPKEYQNIIPNKCNCGSDNMINSDLTIMTCCNPKCFIRMGYSLYNMLQDFGCTGLGPVSCIKICRKGVQDGIFTIPSHIEILYTYKRFEWLLESKYDKLLEAIARIQTSNLKFYQMIQFLGIPGFDKKCFDLFGDIVNFEDLMKKINEVDMITFFGKRGVFDLKQVLTFNCFLKDIRAFEMLFSGTFSRPALKNIAICITGPVSPNGKYLTRKEFIEYCNEQSKVDNVPIFNFMESGYNQSVRYVIADSPSGNRKYVNAKARQNLNPETKLIYTSTEFVDLIRGEVEKCKKRMNSV